MDNTYLISLWVLPENHAEYNKIEEEPDKGLANFRRIINRIKEHPDVESIALAQGSYSLPGSGDNRSGEYRSVEDTSKIAEIQHISIIPEEDYFKVFRHTVNNGKKFISMNDYDWGDPNAIIITQMVAKRLFPGESAIGKLIESNDENPHQYRIIGVIDDLKRFSYYRPHGVIFFPGRINESNYKYTRIGIRTKSNTSASRFVKEFKQQMSSPLRIGNYYMRDITSLVQREKNTNYSFGVTNTIRTHIALMIFFLISISLCILGTFWYRVNIRREEIGIRRAMGSDKGGIKRLFIVEGLILLSIVVLPAMILEIQFISAGLIETIGKYPWSYGDYLPDKTFIRFLITNFITWLILAGIILLAIIYPAWSASRIKPVEALRDE